MKNKRKQKYIINTLLHNGEMVDIVVTAKSEDAARSKFYKGYRFAKILSVREREQQKLSLWNEEVFMKSEMYG